jgi:hypothetical protein
MNRKKGWHHTEETKRKMSEVKLGKNNPMYGKHMTEEWKRTQSKLMSGKNNPSYGKHYSHTEESKLKMSESLKKGYAMGTHVSWNKGKHNVYSEETRKKLSETKINEKNPNWKGNDVKEPALHDWVKRRKNKSKLCENCNEETPFDLANISGEYKRDINDYQWLCRKCHMVSDGRMNNLKNVGK